MPESRAGRLPLSARPSRTARLSSAGPGHGASGTQGTEAGSKSVAAFRQSPAAGAPNAIPRTGEHSGARSPVPAARCIIMGMGIALSEQTLLYPPTGRIMNPNLSEYHVPVHADVPPIDI